MYNGISNRLLCLILNLLLVSVSFATIRFDVDFSCSDYKRAVRLQSSFGWRYECALLFALSYRFIGLAASYIVILDLSTQLESMFEGSILPFLVVFSDYFNLFFCSLVCSPSDL